MEDPNEEEWRIREFCPTDTNEGRLRRLWHIGFSLGKKIALTGMVVSAAPIALPPLAVLSAFGIAFTVPFGFYFASYAVTDKLMSTLLSKPKPPPPPLLLQYEYVFGDDEYEYNIEMAEADGYQEDLDIEEGEEVNDDGCKAFAARHSGICDHSGLSVGIDENLKHMGEVIVDEYEEGGYEEDNCEYMEKEEPIPGVASEILKSVREAEEKISSSMEEERVEILGNDSREAVVVSAEVGDVKQTYVPYEKENNDDFARLWNFSGSMKRKFDDAELEESEKESVGTLEEFNYTDSLEQLKLPSEKGTVEYTKKKEPLPNVASEISAVVPVFAKVVGENDIDIERVEQVNGFGPQVSMDDTGPKIPKLEYVDVEGEILGNDVEGAVEQAELTVGDNINVEQVEEVDVFGPHVRMDDAGPKMKSGDVEPEELEREPKGMVESFSAEDINELLELKSHKSYQDIGDIKHIYAPSETERLQNSWSVEAHFGDAELWEKENVGIHEPLSDDRKDENANLQHGVEKTSPVLRVSGEEFGNILEFVVSNAALQEYSEPVSTSQHTRKDDKAVPTKEDTQDAGNTAMYIIPEGIEKTQDIENVTDPTRENKDWEDIESEKLTEGKNCAIGLRGDNAVEMGTLQNVSGPVEGNFSDFELGVLEKEDVGILEPFSNERRDENANLQHEVEKTSPFLNVSGQEFSNTSNLEQLKFPSGKEFAVTNATLQEFSEPVSTSQDTRTDDEEVSTKECSQEDAGNNATFFIPEKEGIMQDIKNVTDLTKEDNSEGIGSEKLREGTSFAEAIAVDKDLVRVKKLVVHVKKPGYNTATSIQEETVLKTRGKTLICMRANTSATVADDHPEGIDASLPDQVLPSFVGASTSKTTEGLSNEDSIWKQIIAVRSIVGYEATPHSSCVEELKALYVFTGVEPPVLFCEPSSMADVNEKLQFLMAIVGVKM